MIVKELQIQMVNDPPYFCQFLVLTMGVTIDFSYREIQLRPISKQGLNKPSFV